MTLEQRIINIAEKQNYYDSRELRAIALEVRKREDRIKQLEEQLMEVKNKHSALVADVVLDEDRAERIKRLEEALRRIANQDYRGNRSTESQIAFEALKP